MTNSQMSKSSVKLELVSGADNPVRSKVGVQISDFSVWCGENCILSKVNVSLPAQGVTCLVGPSGAGKSTLLRSLNRINEDVQDFSSQGEITILGKNIVDDYQDITQLRSRIGMVFQRPCVFPRSIAENVLFGVRGRKMSKTDKRELIEQSLRSSALWDEVHNRLDQSAMTLSLGQQQRLCIARALAMQPDILLLDEPTASVDPVSARAIEDLVMKLSKKIKIIMVTHDMRQTKRIADHVMFMCDGTLIEAGSKQHMFSPKSLEKTFTYLSEDFCDC